MSFWSFSRVKALPAGAIATFMGLATLGNAYGMLHLNIARFTIMLIGTGVFCAFLMKVIFYGRQFIEDYKNMVLCSLYAAAAMLLMILSAFVYPWCHWLGYWGLIIAVVMDAVHIAVFTIYHVFLHFEKKFMVPSWFVTYFGILVSCVVGGHIMPHWIVTTLLMYAAIAFFLVYIPVVGKVVIWNLPDALIRTKPISIVPLSLILVAYLGNVENKQLWLVSSLYALFVVIYLFFLWSTPRYFTGKFTAAFAGLTFPMAISYIASVKVSAYYGSLGYHQLATIISGMSEVQFVLTNAFLYFVALHFFALWLITKKENA